MASSLQEILWPISRKSCHIGGVADCKSFLSKGSTVAWYDIVGEERSFNKFKSNVCGIVEEVFVKRGDVVSKPG